MDDAIPFGDRLEGIVEELKSGKHDDELVMIVNPRTLQMQLMSEDPKNVKFYATIGKYIGFDEGGVVIGEKTIPNVLLPSFVIEIALVKVYDIVMPRCTKSRIHNAMSIGEESQVYIGIDNIVKASGEMGNSDFEDMLLPVIEEYQDKQV